MEVNKNKLSVYEKGIYQIPLGDLEKGSYMMKIYSEETYMVEKIVLQ